MDNELDKRDLNKTGRKTNGNNPGKSWLDNYIFQRATPIIHTPAALRLFEYSRAFYPNGSHDWVELQHLNLDLPRLPSSFDGYRIVQISDLHIGTWLTAEKLAEAVEMVNRQEPDLIAITGDFVSYHPQEYLDGITSTLKKLSAKDAILAILGNHDHWTDAGMIHEHLADAGIDVLSNRIYSIHRGSSKLHIAGLDDHYVRKDRLDAILNQLPAGECSILLVHEPDFIEISAATGAFDVQMSGHSHGGQIVLPFIGPLYLPRFARKYPSGLYRVKNTYLYTNRGLGTAEIQVRLNCPPEITVFNLHAMQQM
jgi:predicted MPP superfamily phosphohydrolase